MNKIVQLLNYFFQFEESFAFMRRLMLRIKNQTGSNLDNQIYSQILDFFEQDDLSLLSLSLTSGNYSQFYNLIIKVSSIEVNEVELMALTKVVSLLELPYFAYIRLGKNIFLYHIYKYHIIKIIKETLLN